MLKDFLYVFKLIKKIVIYKVDIFKLGGNFLKFWESVMYTYNSCQYYCILSTQENSFAHIIPHKVF